MKTVCEYCNNCETEVVMEWDVETYGYEVYCPFCGARLMLCDECMHQNGELDDRCDYDSATCTCKHSKDNTV